MNEQHTTIAQQLKSGKKVVYYTVGNSMKPLLISRKTHVTIAPLSHAKNKDILLYIRSDGTYVLHRLIRQDESRYYMRGDNTYWLESIKKSQAIGVVTAIRKNGNCINVYKNFRYRLYCTFWNLIYPIRWSLHNGISVAYQIKNKILK